MLDLEAIPESLREATAARWHQLEGFLGVGDVASLRSAFDGDRSLAAEFTRALSLSEFLLDVGCKQPAWFAAFFAAAGFRSAPSNDLIGTTLDGIDAEDTLKRALRLRRNQVMTHFVCRHVLGLSDFDETVAGVTRLAEQCIDGALSRLHEWACAKDGQPIGSTSGDPQRLVVLALGKLGARELNLSSDVDLIFAYPEDGETDSGKRLNQQFFVRLGQRLVQVIDDLTEDGFVFRVDMRLRPYGEGGALTLHFRAMSQYFEEQGRDWERYAWIRARPCAGDLERGEELLSELRPFVFRRYLDFGAVQALREMKSRIDAERSRERLLHDVKLGPGGIREIEFVAQMLQLVWAGRNPSLKVTRVRNTLSALGDAGLMDARQVEELSAAYVFLRNTEHSIQAMRDEQTQLMPSAPDDRLRLALMMRFESRAAFEVELHRHRNNVSTAFEAVIGDQPGEERAGGGEFESLWLRDDVSEVAREMSARGFGAEDALLAVVARLRTLRDRPWVSGEGRKRFDALMPRLLQSMANGERPATTLDRIVPLLEAVMRRSAYFMLLLENPGALELLVSMCAGSRWIAAELARHPMLLDEFLDPALLYTVPDKAKLEADLRARLTGIDDLERQIDILRGFKETHEFRVAACELRDILPLMNVSDYLTFLAEVILAAALDIAWRHTADGDAYLEDNRPFAIIGFGKLGGLELGPGSDLDIVFVHDLPDEHSRFLNRMVRRLIHVLTAHTHAGSLYDIDTRLRPSGRSGTMVSSLSAFSNYQRSDAWVWEHQALVRARPVAGDAAVGAAFDGIRREIICTVRDREALKRQIVEMRRRIEESAGEGVDLKREPGGIVDIEFMVQYLALAWAGEHPSLADWTDNVRILDTAATVGLLTNEVASRLKDAYLALRAERHRTALDIPDDERARSVLERYRAFVRTEWHRMLEPDRPPD